ncbi:oxidoreductase [Terracidiphilus gabretensis]|uniref:oxidoreductase n=1 Tax=Terracidiphilus gabretensis TaxID=1577687 RepID=UPI00071BB696|nr:oxidoreductase [Terracidiphilus gabretensis]
MSEQTKQWTANLIPSQSGRRVVITGANSGIGFETALELARKGAEIILPARSLAKANDAINRIRKEIPSASLVPAVLDLASQASVREFASWFSAQYPGPSIDLLINNAGVMAIPKRELTVDGFERQFATNFLGPFALTALLYPHMRQQQGNRIVIVSSSITKFAKIDFANLQSEHRYSPMAQAYAQSKLADSLFALELHRRMAKAGSPVIVTSAHPGYAITNLQTSGPGTGLSPFQIVAAILKPFASQDAAHGALPTLFAAVAPQAASGDYYGPDGFSELKGYPKLVPIPSAAQDPKDAERLWREAETLTGITFRP